MSDYIIVTARHILILKGAAQARLGSVCALLVFPASDDSSLRFCYSDVARKQRDVWRDCKARQAFCVSISPRSAGLVSPLADQELSHSESLRCRSA